MTNGPIEHFVKGTLGCDCPDEVFDNVEVLRKIALGGGLTIDAVITVGDRLLLYLMKARTPPTLIADTVRLVKIGRIERDMRGLNRFRLVLFTQDMVAIKPEAEKIFGSCVEVDDKIHLHVIEEKVASDFLGSVKTVP